MRIAIAAFLLVFGACTTVRSGVELPTPEVRTPGMRTTTNMPSVPSNAIRAHVTRVVDGDTIVLSGISFGLIDHRTGGHRARLIGIDTPEIHNGVECYGQAASDFTTRALDGKDVRVTFDVDTVDRYGRALVYVWEPDGTFFNGELAEQGIALQATFPPNVRYVELLSRLVTEARTANRGLWKAC